MGGWWYVGHFRIPREVTKRLHLLSEEQEGLPSKFRRKVIPKIWYFTVNAGAVFFLPFLSIYWKQQLGYSPRQIGLLQALRPWVSAITSNIISPVADAWDMHYVMLLLTYALTITSRGLITLGWPFGLMMVLALVMEGSVAPMSVLVDATVVAGSTKDGTYGRARLWASIGWGVFAPVAGVIINEYGIHVSFMIFAAVYAVASVPTCLIPAGLLGSRYRSLRTQSEIDSENASAAVSASDAGSLAVAEKEKESAKKGDVVVVVAATEPPQLPLDGEITTEKNNYAMPGPNTATLSRRVSRAANSSSHHNGGGGGVDAQDSNTPQDMSIVRDRTVTVVNSEETKKPALDAASITISTPTPPLQQQHSDLKSTNQRTKNNKESLWSMTKPLLTDVYVLTFLFMAFLMGVGNGFVGYLFLELSELGAKGTLLGVCLTMNCIGEVPFFYYSGAIIKKLGVYPSLNIGMAAYCLRLGCYALLPYYPSLWIVLPVEVLQGLTFGLSYSAGTVHCRRIAPKKVRSTMQSIFAGLYTGFGAGVGGLAGGFIYGAAGGQIMFLSGLGILFAGWIAINFTNLVHGMRRGVKQMKRVGSALWRESMHRISPNYSYFTFWSTRSDTSSSSGSSSDASTPSPCSSTATSMTWEEEKRGGGGGSGEPIPADERV